mmetsp:Transcript_8605/g.26890  ORF Transcript_8605/g.26890 Transcript_8605/m.26890 type:complete len:205 (-) Transcript_8605:19-633(-)
MARTLSSASPTTSAFAAGASFKKPRSAGASNRSRATASPRDAAAMTRPYTRPSSWMRSRWRRRIVAGSRWTSCRSLWTAASSLRASTVFAFFFFFGCALPLDLVASAWSRFFSRKFSSSSARGTGTRSASSASASGRRRPARRSRTNAWTLLTTARVAEPSASSSIARVNAATAAARTPASPSSARLPTTPSTRSARLKDGARA